MVALAQDSHPALPILRNTCAGIKEPRMFAHVARIRVAKTGNGPDDHLELVFMEDTKEGPHHTIIMPSEAVELSFGSLSHGAVKVGEVYGGL